MHNGQQVLQHSHSRIFLNQLAQILRDILPFYILSKIMILTPKSQKSNGKQCNTYVQNYYKYVCHLNASNSDQNISSLKNLIFASAGRCKTYTALKITLGPKGKNGNMFFYVPSIIQIIFNSFAKILYKISSTLLFVTLADILKAQNHLYILQNL